MNITLVRDIDNGVCSLGTLLINGATIQTLERPWIASLGSPGGCKGVSCVPAGLYRLVRHDTEAHPRSFALENEDLGVYHYDIPAGKSGRTACLIHVANVVSELRGCVALGMARSGNSISQSRMAVDRFYNALPWVDNEHTIDIKGAP